MSGNVMESKLTDTSPFAFTNRNNRVSHRAVVLNNVDPLGLSRIQVSIQSLLQEEDADLCPWVYPGNKVAGTSPANNHQNIPEIGTEVKVYNEAGKEGIYFYTGSPDNLLTATGELFSDPDIIGDVKNDALLFLLNRKTGEITFYQHIFSQLFQIDEEGRFHINIAGDVVLSGENIYLKPSGNFVVDAGEDVGINCNQFEIQGTGDSSVSTDATLGLNGLMIQENAGIKAGIINGLLSDVSEVVENISSKISDLGAKVAELLSKDKSNRKRIGRE